MENILSNENTEKTLCEQDLKYFTGTDQRYHHPIFRKCLYTEGVQYLAEQGGAYWLIDKIFGLQYENINMPEQEFQVWDLKVNPDNSANLTCHDGDYNWQHGEKLTYTDFPLKEIKLYFINNILLLTGEY